MGSISPCNTCAPSVRTQKTCCQREVVYKMNGFDQKRNLVLTKAAQNQERNRDVGRGESVGLVF